MPHTSARRDIRCTLQGTWERCARAEDRVEWGGEGRAGQLIPAVPGAPAWAASSGAAASTAMESGAVSGKRAQCTGLLPHVNEKRQPNPTMGCCSGIPSQRAIILISFRDRSCRHTSNPSAARRPNVKAVWTRALGGVLCATCRRGTLHGADERVHIRGDDSWRHDATHRGWRYDGAFHGIGRTENRGVASGWDAGMSHFKMDGDRSVMLRLDHAASNGALWRLS
jgi:hypothetical protein